MNPLEYFSAFVREVRGRLSSRVFRIAINKAVREFGITGDAVRNVRSLRRLFGESEGGFPTELFKVGASMWSGYMLTPFAEQQMKGWVFPYWLRKQTDPSSSSFVPHSHAYFYANKTHRNWTGVGIPGFPYEASVDVRGLITPWAFGPSIDIWWVLGDDLICPSELENVSQEILFDLPIVRTFFEADGVRLSLKVFMGAPQDTVVLLGIAEAENLTKNAMDAATVVSIRPYNTESISAINKITYRPGDRCFDTDGKPILYLTDEPDEVILSDYLHGDVALLLRDKKRRRPPSWSTQVEEPSGLATAAAIFKEKLKPGKKSAVIFACPVPEGSKPPFTLILPERKSLKVAHDELDRQRKLWEESLSTGITLSVEDEVYAKALKINKTYLLLLYDGPCITPGVSTYHMMWFRDAAYLVPALERTGNLELARAILLTYPDRQTKEGFFRSHSGEWDSNGQAMWTLVNHYKMTGDIEFLKKVYPSIMKGARWLDEKRMLDLDPKDPRYGLLPPGVSAEHFGLNDCYYWDDLWAIGGLLAAGEAADALRFESDARYCKQLARDFEDSLKYSWEKVSERLGRKVIPISPSRDFDSASIGILCAVYPLNLFSPDDPAIANTVKELVDKCFYNDVHFHGIFHCGLNPYLTMHVAQYFLKKKDTYALRIFESLMSISTETMTFPEAINPHTGGGAYGDGHHGWAVADIFNFVRNLFLMEENERLLILPLSKREWLEDKKRIILKNAPTTFGEVSYTISSESVDVVRIELNAKFREAPKEIEITLPFAIETVSVDGKQIEFKRGMHSVQVSPHSKEIHLSVDRGG